MAILPLTRHYLVHLIHPVIPTPKPLSYYHSTIAESAVDEPGVPVVPRAGPNMSGGQGLGIPEPWRRCCSGGVERMPWKCSHE